MLDFNAVGGCVFEVWRACSWVLNQGLQDFLFINSLVKTEKKQLDAEFPPFTFADMDYNYIMNWISNRKRNQPGQQKVNIGREISE